MLRSSKRVSTATPRKIGIIKDTNVPSAHWAESVPVLENLTWEDLRAGGRIQWTISTLAKILAYCSRHQISKANLPSPSQLHFLTSRILFVPVKALEPEVYTIVLNKLLSCIVSRTDKIDALSLKKEGHVWVGEWYVWSRKWFEDEKWDGNVDFDQDWEGSVEGEEQLWDVREMLPGRHEMGKTRLISATVADMAGRIARGEGWVEEEQWFGNKSGEEEEEEQEEQAAASHEIANDTNNENNRSVSSDEEEGGKGGQQQQVVVEKTPRTYHEARVEVPITPVRGPSSSSAATPATPHNVKASRPKNPSVGGSEVPVTTVNNGGLPIILPPEEVEINTTPTPMQIYDYHEASPSSLNVRLLSALTSQQLFQLLVAKKEEEERNRLENYYSSPMDAVHDGVMPLGMADRDGGHGNRAGKKGTKKDKYGGNKTTKIPQEDVALGDNGLKAAGKFSSARQPHVRFVEPELDACGDYEEGEEEDYDGYLSGFLSD